MMMPMCGKLTLNLPSPIQEIEHPLFKEKKVSVYLKRDDLIHPQISGNKWRKLKYNIRKAGSKELLTFGGAFSNHIAATAAACNYYGSKSIGIIRGDMITPLNNTLALAEENGMELKFISRASYKLKSSQKFLKEIKDEFNDPFIVPEGGANYLGLMGCREVIREIDIDFDYIISAIGTGATIAGLAQGLKKHQKAIGISVLKGAYSLSDEIKELLDKENEDSLNVMNKIEVNHDYHFGGYAKIKDELIAFMREFYQEFKIKTDPVYSGKSLYALFDMLKKDRFKQGSRIVYYHCGGLQGIEGIEKKYKFEIY